MEHPSSRLFRVETVGRSLRFYLPLAIAHRLMGLVRGVVLAWLMTAHQYGTFEVALLATNILVPLGGLGLSDSLARYVPQYETRRRLRPFLARAVPFALLVPCLLCLAGLLTSGPISRLIFAPFSAAAQPSAGEQGTAELTLTRVTLLVSLVVIAFFVVQSTLRGLRMFLAVGLLELAGSAAFTLATVVVAVVLGGRAEPVMSCYGAAHLATLLLFAVPLWSVVRRRERPDSPASDLSEPAGPLFRRMLRFGVWSALAATTWQTMQYYPIWHLQKVSGPEVTAVFAGVRLITQAVLIGVVSIVTVVQTSVTKTWESEGAERADRQLRLAHKSSSVLMLAGCAVLAFAAPWIMRLYPDRFAAGTAVFPLVLLFFLVGGQLAFLTIHFTLIEKTGYLFLLWAVGLVGNALFGRYLVHGNLAPAEALAATAWAGVLGVSGALLLGLAFLWFERRATDRGSLVLIAAGYLLALPSTVTLPLIAVLIALILSTRMVLDAEEKRRLTDYARALGRGLRRRVG